MAKSSIRAQRRADRDGHGPSAGVEAPGPFPGAKNWFALLGEVLLIGIVIAVLSLPLLTLPVALAAGIRHLRRFLRAEDSSAELLWNDVKRGVVGSLGIGAMTLLVVLILLLDIDLAGSGALPGGELIGILGGVGLIAVAVGLFAAAGRWTPETRWRGALRAVPAALREDPAGAAYLVATVLFAAIVTWQLLPLIVPALGCVALAVVAVPERPRRVKNDAEEWDGSAE